jgi:predicted amidophosphoribosyltransferase
MTTGKMPLMLEADLCERCGRAPKYPGRTWCAACALPMTDAYLAESREALKDAIKTVEEARASVRHWKQEAAMLRDAAQDVRR